MTNILTLDTTYVDQYLDSTSTIAPPITLKDAYESLQNGTCKGSEYLGWLSYPTSVPLSLLDEIRDLGQNLRDNNDVMIVCGIGGSYLGARAVIDALGGDRVVYLGNHLSGREYDMVFAKYRDKQVVACVISKSGTTLETAISYRLVRQFLLSKYDEEELNNRIITVTDEKNGALRVETIALGYRSFILPGNIGGRYSVFTPVGLIPLAFAGIDIHQLIRGAKQAILDIASYTTSDAGDWHHPAFVYALKRSQMELVGFVSELFIIYEPSLYFLGEWWEQLMGESHGKKGKGLFPGGLTYTTDLHSIGQYVQEGRRLFFETMLWIDKPLSDAIIPSSKDMLDGLDVITGKSLHEINKIALDSTAKAHFDGGCPSVILQLRDLSSESLGYFCYTMMMSCALSGIMLGINPFDQPGVEAYKLEMRKHF